MFVGPAIVGSFLAMLVLGGIPSLGDALSRLVARRRRGLFDHSRAHVSLDSLRNAILGSGKREIAAILGLPLTTAAGDYETWYYALRSHERLAMAISFEQGRARNVEFFQAPR